MSFWKRQKKSEEVERSQPQPAPLDDSAARFCRSDMYRYPAGEDLHFVYCSLDRSVHTLSSRMLHLLDSCSTFKAMSDHARDYFNATPDIADIQEVEQQFSKGLVQLTKAAGQTPAVSNRNWETSGLQTSTENLA